MAPLKISEEIARGIRAHGAETYPNECCGALLGREDAEGREVLGLLPLINRRADSPQNRFSLTPEDVRGAENAAREKGWDLIGWYHSHPDSPARPSEYDREHAWPWFSYIIVSVVNREAREIFSWRLSEDRSAFAPEEISLASGATF
ncbi:MAG: Mov34/MPN/PAD-1 family protein [Candidatus Acidiferrales bacterium]